MAITHNDLDVNHVIALTGCNGVWFVAALVDGHRGIQAQPENPGEEAIWVDVSEVTEVLGAQSPRTLDRIKGDHPYAAGVMAARMGRDDNYGCHFGMRSTYQSNCDQFRAGHRDQKNAK